MSVMSWHSLPRNRRDGSMATPCRSTAAQSYKRDAALDEPRALIDPRGSQRRCKGIVQQQLAGADIVPLLHGGVLCRGLQVAQPPLQWRGIINCAAAAEREARIGHAHAGSRNPDRGLRPLCEERLIRQRSRKRVAPMACRLGVKIRLGRAEIGRRAAEFALECFRISHRDGGPLLPPSGIGKLDDGIERALGDAEADGGVCERNELRYGLVEGPRQARWPGEDIGETRRRNDRVGERNVMASGPLEPRYVPGVLDLPVLRRQREGAEQRLAVAERSGDRLAAF